MTVNISVLKTKENSIFFKSKSYLWSLTILGLIFYGFAGFFLIYATLLQISEELRSKYSNLSIAAFIATIIVYYIGKYIIIKLGSEDIQISELFYVLHNNYGRTRKILVKNILLIKINRINPILEFLPLSAPEIIIVTYSGKYILKTIKYKNSEEMIEFFEKKSSEFDDEFALFFHRSQNNISRFINRFVQDTSGVIGFTIILVFTFLSIWGAFAMLISPITPLSSHTLFLRNPDFLNFGLKEYKIEDVLMKPPSKDFWFGTDFIGRDLFSRLIFGTTFTFMIAITGSFFSILFILLFGVSSAFYPGKFDNVIMRMSDALLSFPPFVFLIIFSAVSIPLRAAVPGGFFLAVYTGMSLVTWPSGARIIRSEVKNLLESEYILASKQLGASNWKIMRTHILPQIIPTILILLTYQMTDIILGTTMLGYIGFGSESTLTWGSDLSHALFDLSFVNNWWTVLFPSLFIFLLVFGLTLLSDSIRDNLDPRLQGGLNALPYEIRQELNI